jgi:D-glycero-D-manno-heptose 1,7-bisphosphate phosphatase
VNRAIFLDRDGVINQSIVINGKPFAPTKLEHFKILPGVIEALNRFKNAGFKTVVVTNQPDITTGKQTWKSLNEIHDYLLLNCKIDLIKVCSHTGEQLCGCRKPHPGMLTEAAHELGIDLSESFMIGDRWGDIKAGQSAGCKKNFFIDYGYTEKKPTGNFILVNSLQECADKSLLHE